MAHIKNFDALEYGNIVAGPDASTAFTVGSDDHFSRKADNCPKSLSDLTNGDTIMYRAQSLDDSSEWEVGLGTYVSASKTLTRTTVLASSNSDSAVNFLQSGSKGSFVKVVGLNGIASTASAWTVTNFSADRTISATEATAANVAASLATVVNDLIDAGVLKGTVA
jgi:hypothetical protein